MHHYAFYFDYMTRINAAWDRLIIIIAVYIATAAWEDPRPARSFLTVWAAGFGVVFFLEFDELDSELECYYRWSTVHGLNSSVLRGGAMWMVW
jgi:hypothetical protein